MAFCASRTSMLTVAMGCLLLALGAAQGADAPKDDRQYRVVARYAVEGKDSAGEMAVDPAARRLYVSRGTQVEVLDLDSGERMGRVAPMGGVRSVAVAPELKRGFATSGGDAVAVFDLGTLEVTRTIKSTGQDPDAILYDAFTRRVFVANARTGNVTVIDAATGDVLSTVPLGGRLHQMSTNGYGRLFVAVEDRKTARVVDTRSMEVLGDFPVAPGEKCAGIFADGIVRNFWVTCGNGKVVVIASDSGLGGEQPKLSGPPGLAAGVVTEREAVDSEAYRHGRAYLASSEGTLTVLDMGTPPPYRVFQKLQTEPGAHAVAVDPRTHRVFVSAPSAVLVIGR